MCFLLFFKLSNDKRNVKITLSPPIKIMKKRKYSKMYSKIAKRMSYFTSFVIIKIFSNNSILPCYEYKIIYIFCPLCLEHFESMEVIKGIWINSLLVTL